VENIGENVYWKSGEGIVEEENVSSFYQKQIPYGVHTLTLTLH